MTVNEAIFEGRINRREYLARTLFGSVLLAAGLWPVILKVTATEGLMADVPKSTLAFPVMLVLAAVGWGCFLPAMIRRLHDFNLSGWWIFWLSIIRVVLFVVTMDNLMPGLVSYAMEIVLLLYPGTKGLNRFGMPPFVDGPCAKVLGFDIRRLAGRYVIWLVVFAVFLETVFILVFARQRIDWWEVKNSSDPEAVAKWLNGLTCRKLDYGEFNSEMSGRSLTMTGLRVRDCRELGLDWRMVACEMPYGIRLGLYVPTSVMEELPRDLQWNDTVDLVTGRIPERDAKLPKSRYVPIADRYNSILLVVNRIDTPLKNERVPVICQDIAGDELVKVAMRLPFHGYYSDRDARCVRLCRPLRGKRLTFSRFIVKGFNYKTKVPYVEFFAIAPNEPENSRGMPFQVSLGDSESASRRVLESLVSGQVVQNVRATVCGTEDFDEDNDFGARCVWMKDLEFDVDKPNVPLPSFDADAISVSELVELLKRNGNMLSSGQLRELQHRLAGRRLAFRGLEVGDDWTQDTEFVCKSVGLALLVGWKDRVRRRRDLMSEQTVEATVAAEPCSRWNGSLAIRLVDGKLGSATGD